MESEPPEQWRPGKVEINKISKGFPYLVASWSISPPLNQLSNNTIPSTSQTNRLRPIPEISQYWNRRSKQRKALKQEYHAKNHAINDTNNEAMLDSGATSNFIQSASGLKLTGPSSKIVSTANGQVMKATMTALLPLTQLKDAA